MSDNSPKKKVHRVQIDFSEDAYNQLLKLKEDDGVDSVSSLIKNALGLYDWYLLEKKQGAEILVRKNGEVEKIVFNETEAQNDS